MPTEFQKQFGGSPLKSGSVLGVRTFNAPNTMVVSGQTPGSLIGLREGVWLPGENVAVCKQPGSSIVRTLDELFPWQIQSRFPHRVANPACECGFYAYFNAKDTSVFQVKSVYAAIGVIEGYGSTTIGRLGFRCEKAKILAVFPFQVLPSGIRVGDALAQTLYLQTPFLLDPAVWDLVENKEHTAKLQRIYPNVAFFKDLETMLSEFPPTRPEEV